MRHRLCLAVLLAACSSAADDDESTDPRLTYHDDVAPILALHCADCHVDGGLAPFAVDDYAAVAEWAAPIVESTTARTMPPYGADNSGACNTFTDARWLSDEEIAVLAQWLDDGALEGEPPAEPPVPPAPKPLPGPGIEELRTPSYEPLPETELGGVVDDYQCFLLDPGIDETRYVVGYEVVPGNAAIVHHLLGFQVDPATYGNAETMQELDDASPLGWDCRGAAGENVIPKAVPVGWAPGVGATLFPAGTGTPIGPDDVIVVQMHYNVANGSGTDETTIRLKYADEVAEPAIQSITDPFLEQAFGGAPPTLPAGVESATYEWTLPIGHIVDLPADTDVEVWGFAPHMHQRGRKMHIRIERDGAADRCAAEIDRYDFAWQRLYFLERPLVAKAGDRLAVTCDWDTRGDSEPVLPGFTTAAEMCTLAIYVVPK
jgi:hypothetical protein